MSGVTARARKIVEDHMARWGALPQPERLIQEIATELGFIQLASIPHRADVQMLKAQVELLREAHEEANQALRSAWSVAEREGKETNWVGHRTQLRASLDCSHAARASLEATLPQVPPVQI